MNSPMQLALGADWSSLPTALKAHYRHGATVDTGQMDVDYPRFMQPYLSLLRLLGALVNQRGAGIPTVVEKTVIGDRQVWRRTITYPNGRRIHFNSTWVHAGGNKMIEFVNPLLGLKMEAWREESRLRYRGICFVLKLGKWHIPLPEWLLGQTTIVEEAIDDTHFAMDFRLTHPLFGQVFRYSGTFAVEVNCQDHAAPG